MQDINIIIELDGRTAVITNYAYSSGCIEEVRAHWKNTWQELTDEEQFVYGEDITQACLDDLDRIEIEAEEDHVDSLINKRA